MIDYGLKGKVALVTGASHGIGKACTDLLLEQGCTVIGIARWRKGKPEYEGLIPIVKDLSTMTYVECMSNRYEIKKIISAAGSTPEILINNFGGGGSLEQSNERKDYIRDSIINRNLFTMTRFTDACLPDMLQQNYGRVITISSIYGREAGGNPWFTAAKSGQIAWSKAMSDKTTCNITFNVVAPGPIFIEGTGWDKMKQEDPEKYKKEEEKIPLKRLGTPEEVANLVLFLCSQQASYINGSCIAVDGGLSRSF
jgi:3-oxoacyl-[acyl-carrier protein] reductase